ncbi:MAG: xanthine dehydrogenase family protein molybdopterin-binding subunit [Deltaproteobacteria bacterium]|nr:xanthine dehydrogenase family protein molybdopterin-binding subunit [Deltaproteobacteria bacterium]
MATSALGSRSPRLDAADKTTGKAIFAGDLALPGLAWGKFLLSPHAHARIRRIDTTRAEQLPGVIAVVTHRDVPDVLVGELVKDIRLFQKDKVRYIGDIVAGVVAEDLRTAEEAVKLIDVDYEVLPAVTDAEEAMKPSSPLIHEEHKSYQTIPPLAEAFKAVQGHNICWHTEIRKGDVERGLAEADHVLEETYTAPMGHGAPIEPHALVASVDAQGKVTVWTATQVPFVCREQVAEALHLPMSKVRIIAPPIGGGFGAKCQAWVEPNVAAMAIKARRPVKLLFTREEEFMIGQPRHPAKVHVKSGVKKDGTLVARQVRVILDTGYSTMLGPIVSSLGSMCAPGTYRIPNLAVDIDVVFTNKPSCSAVRGPAGPQTVFAVESHTDHLAKLVGMDPVEFRLKNCWDEGDEGPTGQILQGVGLKEALRRAAEKAEWGRPLPPNHGRGVALAWWLTLAGFGCAVTVTLNEDGSVTLQTGAVDHGTGSTFGGLPLVIAEELGIETDQISVINSDTDTTPFDYGGVGSRTTFNQAHAVRPAVQDVKRQLFERAGQMLEVSPDDLEMKGGKIAVRGVPDKAIPVLMLTHLAPFTGGPIVGRGTFNTPPPAFDPKKATVKGSVSPTFNAPSFGAQVAEVEVDPETGNITVTKVVAALDVGRALNPLGVEGQIHGGVVQGIGIALTERSEFENGRMLNPNFVDFKIPLITDIPPIEAIIVESPAANGPYGAKGVGEPPVLPTAGAIANAVCAATGARVRDLPLTPERVLEALRRRG